MDYAIKNLRDVNDVAAGFGFSEVQEARFAREDLGSETVGLAFHVVKPNCRRAFAHRHVRAEEIYVVLSGTGRMKLDDDVRNVGPMDAIRSHRGSRGRSKRAPMGSSCSSSGRATRGMVRFCERISGAG